MSSRTACVKKHKNQIVLYKGTNDLSHGDYTVPYSPQTSSSLLKPPPSVPVISPLDEHQIQRGEEKDEACEPTFMVPTSTPTTSESTLEMGSQASPEVSEVLEEAVGDVEEGSVEGPSRVPQRSKRNRSEVNYRPFF